MKISTLGYALLGLLARRPLAGYDLAQQMKAPIGFFWPAGHSQIYPELARLESAGLIRHEVEVQRDRPDKKNYALTPAGEAALRAWVTAPPAPRPTRDELVLKAFSLWLAEPAAASALFREQARQHQFQLAKYEEFRQQMEAAPGAALTNPASPQWATYATLRRGIGHEREMVEWCRWIADSLESSTGARASGPDRAAE